LSPISSTKTKCPVGGIFCATSPRILLTNVPRAR